MTSWLHLALAGFLALPAAAAPALAQGGAADERLATPRVLAIEVVGNQRFSDVQLITALGQPIGSPLSETRIEEGIKTLWRDFHVHADVDFRQVIGGVELRRSAEERPVDLEPRFVGMVGVSRDVVLEWAGVEQGAELFLHEAPLVRERLVDGYRHEGYHFVEVDIV